MQLRRPHVAAKPRLTLGCHSARRPSSSHLVLAQLGLHKLLVEHGGGGEVGRLGADQGGLRDGDTGRSGGGGGEAEAAALLHTSPQLAHCWCGAAAPAAWGAAAGRAGQAAAPGCQGGVGGSSKWGMALDPWRIGACTGPRAQIWACQPHRARSPGGPQAGRAMPGLQGVRRCCWLPPPCSTHRGLAHQLLAGGHAHGGGHAQGAGVAPEGGGARSDLGDGGSAGGNHGGWLGGNLVGGGMQNARGAAHQMGARPPPPAAPALRRELPRMPCLRCSDCCCCCLSPSMNFQGCCILEGGWGSARDGHTASHRHRSALHVRKPPARACHRTHTLVGQHAITQQPAGDPRQRPHSVSRRRSAGAAPAASDDVRRLRGRLGGGGAREARREVPRPEQCSWRDCLPAAQEALWQEALGAASSC